MPNIDIDGLTIIYTGSSSSKNIPIFYGRSIIKVDGTLKYSNLSSSDGIGIYNLSEYINVGSYDITDGTTSTGQELYLGQFYNKSNVSIPDLTEDNVSFTRSEDDWTNESVTVWVEITDDEIQEEIDNGTYTLEYSTDEGETWEIYNSDEGITVEENIDIEIRLTNGTEYGETIEINVDNIDKTSPKIYGVKEDSIYNEEVNVTIVDEDSGISEIIVTKDGEETIYTDTEITLSDYGEYTIKVIDIAGNISTISFSIEEIESSNATNTNDTLSNESTQANTQLSELSETSNEIDTTTASGSLPNTGIKMIIFIIIVFCIISANIIFIRLKDYKEIK